MPDDIFFSLFSNCLQYAHDFFIKKTLPTQESHDVNDQTSHVQAILTRSPFQFYYKYFFLVNNTLHGKKKFSS